jgi:hypothetical protein
MVRLEDPLRVRGGVAALLAQVCSAVSWSADSLTQEGGHVADHCLAVALIFCESFASARGVQDETRTVTMAQQKPIFVKFLPDGSSGNGFFGRVPIIGASGSGKAVLT